MSERDDDDREEQWREDVLDRLEQSRTLAGMAADRGVLVAGGWIEAIESALEWVRYGR